VTGMWRDLVPLALALGAIYFTAFAIPLATAAAAFGRANHLKDSWSSDGLTWVLIAATVVSAFITFDIYVETKQVCDDLRSGMATERLLSSLGGTYYTNQYIEKCTNSPF
jgi:hypothetical protein